MGFPRGRGMQMKVGWDAENKRLQDEKGGAARGGGCREVSVEVA